MNDSSTLSSVNSPASEPCPTPLAWQEVVRSFNEQIRQGPLEFRGGRVTVTQFGSGPPLVVLPPSLGSPKLFALTAWLLKDEFELWLLDHPEFAKTPKPSELVDQTGEAYAAICSQVPGGPVNLFASAFGGQVALAMMSRTPQIIRKAVLQSSWGHRPVNSVERLLLNAGRLVPFRIKRVPLWLSTQVQNHRPWFPPFDETRFGFLLSETYKSKASDVARRALAASCSNLLAEAETIQTETFLLRCEGDGTQVTEAQDQLERRLTNCRSDWMHSSGYYPYLTHPHRLVKYLREFYGAET